MIPQGASGGNGGPAGAGAHFADRLARAIEEKGSCLVVGIDPVLDRLPGEVRSIAGSAGSDPRGWSTVRAAAALGLFSGEVIRAVAPSAVCVKPNTAFFERYGPPGWEALQETCRRAKGAGLLVIVDGKRGDLESTAEAYADAFLGDLPDTLGPFADAITVNPYLGTDGIRPFLKRARDSRKGIFVLVRTSNPSASEIQDLESGGRPIYRRVAELVDRWGADLMGECGLSAVGAVVGATAPRQAAEIRSALGRSFFLVPGYGAQGAGAEEIRPHFLPGGRGVVVNSSRSVIFAYEKDRSRPWPEAVARAAGKARDELEAVRKGI